MEIGYDGNLYDERNGFAKPLRTRFRFRYSQIDTPRQLLSTLRAGRFTSIGSYPLFFYTSDGGALSFESVRAELPSVLWSIRNKVDDGWRVIGCAVNYEDEGLVDDHSGELIPSAYGEI